MVRGVSNNVDVVVWETVYVVHRNPDFARRFWRYTYRSGGVYYTLATPEVLQSLPEDVKKRATEEVQKVEELFARKIESVDMTSPDGRLVLLKLPKPVPPRVFAELELRPDRHLYGQDREFVYLSVPYKLEKLARKLRDILSNFDYSDPDAIADPTTIAVKCMRIVRKGDTFEVRSPYEPKLVEFFRRMKRECGARWNGECWVLPVDPRVALELLNLLKVHLAWNHPDRKTLEGIAGGIYANLDKLVIPYNHPAFNDLPDRLKGGAYAIVQLTGTDLSDISYVLRKYEDIRSAVLSALKPVLDAELELVEDEYGRRFILRVPKCQLLDRCFDFVRWLYERDHGAGHLAPKYVRSEGFYAIPPIVSNLGYLKSTIEIVERALGVKTRLGESLRRWAKVIIEVSNVGRFIVRPPIPVDKELEEELRYQPEGYQFTKAYREGRWDGWIRLYKPKRGEFVIGFLPRVIEKLREANEEFEIIDKRSEGAEIDVEYAGPELRWYQKEAVERYLSSYGVGTLVLPTGTGKTLTALAIVSRIRRRTLIIVHKIELLNQWVECIRKYLRGRFKLGVIGAGEFRLGDITVAMVQTLVKNLERIPNDYFGLVIFDEAHHVPADTFWRIANYFSPKWRLGLTATPYRAKTEEAMKIFGGAGVIVYIRTVEELQEYLARPHFILVRYPPFTPPERTKTYAQERKWLIVANPHRNLAICEVVKRLFREGARIYIHVELVAHGRILRDLLRRIYGIPAVFVCGSDDPAKRRSVLKRFEEKGDFVLISTLLGEGVDIPPLNVLVVACGGKSPLAKTQLVGRALRKYPGKDRAIIVDLLDTKGKYLWEHTQTRLETYERVYRGAMTREDLDLTESVLEVYRRHEDEVRRIIETHIRALS